MSAQTLVSTRGLSREEWLEWRRRGIGSSEVAAVVGLDPWKSPLEVYYDKLGEIPDEDAGEAAYWGTVLEGVIADEFARRSGRMVRRRLGILQHASHPFMLANLDRVVVGGDEGPAVLECKAPGLRAADRWEDEIPVGYELQVQHQLAVTGWPRGYLAMLVGGQEFRVVTIDADPEVHAMLVDLEGEFWRHVQERVPPPVDGSDATRDVLARVFPDAVAGKTVELPAEALELVEDRQLAAAAEKAAGERKTRAENALKLLLGDGEVATVDGIPVFTWKSTAPRKFDTDAFKSVHPELYEQFRTPRPGRRVHFPKRPDST